MEILRWQIGDATVFRIAELDATAALSHCADPVAGRIRRAGTGFRLAPVEE